MKTIGTLQNGDTVIGYISGPDACNQEITVNGRIWRFDFDRYGGPLWLRADGEPRKCQCPTAKAVWDAFEAWHKEWKSERTKQEVKP